MQQPIPPSGPDNARLMIVGEAPGAHELQARQPFLGVAGQELHRMLSEVGLAYREVRVTNVCHLKPPGGDINQFFAMTKTGSPSKTLARQEGLSELYGQYPRQPILDGMAFLERELHAVRPSVILAFDNAALWALTGEWGVGKWRGSLLKTRPGLPFATVIPTHSPQSILRKWEWRWIALQDMRRALKELDNPTPEPAYHFYIEPSYHAAIQYLQHLLTLCQAGPTPLSVDIETSNHFIDCIGFAWSKRDAFCIPFTRTGGEHYWSEEDELEIRALIRNILSHPNAKIIGQNYLYDAQYIFNEFLFLSRCHMDTMVTHHLCYPGLPKSLAFLASLYCNHYRYWKDDLKEHRKIEDYHLYWRYNCLDACYTFEVAEALTQVVPDQGKQTQYQFQHRMWHRLLKTMLRGVRVDIEKKGEFSLSLLTQLAEYEHLFIDLIGEKLPGTSKTAKPWYRSPKQIQQLFYDEFGLPIRKNRKSGNVSSDDEALKSIAEKDPLFEPLCTTLLDYRSLGVFHSTFIEAKPSSDGRMRTSYNLAGTNTFRLSSSTDAYGEGLNLQNTPRPRDKE